MYHTRLGKLAALSILCTTCGMGQIITTVAGTSWFFPNNIPALNAPIGLAYSIAIDSNGNLFIADDDNSIVTKVSPAGVLTIVAGNGTYGFSGDGGPATSAALSGHMPGLAVDAGGNLYIADEWNFRIRKVTPDGTISTVAGTSSPGFTGDGGPATSATLNCPQGVAVDLTGNIYIVDQFNNRIRKVIPTGTISTVAGNGSAGFSGDGGPATSAAVNNPLAVTVDSAGNLYIYDSSYRIRKVKAVDGSINTIAGTGAAGFSGDGGPATSATFSSPIDGLAVDTSGNLYIGDSGNSRVRKVTPGGTISTIAGSGLVGFAGDGGAAINAALNNPLGVALDTAANLYIADFSNGRVRMVTPGGTIGTVAGNGLGIAAGDGGPSTSGALHQPQGVALDLSANIYIGDTRSNRIRKVSHAGIIGTAAGNGFENFSGDGGPAVNATLNAPQRVALDTAGNLYFSDSTNNRVRKVNTQGTISTVAGGGTSLADGISATQAALGAPKGLAVDSSGNIYIVDVGNSRIRKVTPNGIITTVAGNRSFAYSGDGGPATSASLNLPFAVAVDGAGSLYIADTNNNRIRKVTPDGTIRTIAGTGTGGFSGDGGPATAAQLNSPSDVTLDSAGNLYIADGYTRIRKVTAAGTIMTVAGNGSSTSSGDGGLATSAGLLAYSVAVDGSGNLYVADINANRIRQVFVATSPSIQAQPGSLSFTAIAGGSSPAQQTVNLISSIAGVAFTVSSSAPWLTVTPGSGAMPASVQVVVDPSQLSTGTFQGTVTVTAPLASPPVAIVAVSCTVNASQPSQLSIGTQSLSFAVSQAGAAQSQQLQVANSGGGTLSFGATATTSGGGQWLSVSSATASATPTTAASLTVTANPGSLPTGTYTGTVSITPSGSSNPSDSTLVPVTLSISSQGPTILVSQTGLAFTAVSQGGLPLPQTFGILNTGQGSMNWSATGTTVSGGNDWLQVSPSSGTVTQPYLDVSSVMVSIDPSGLSPGNYYGRIQVSAASANSPQVLTVILNVLPPGTSPGPEVQPSGLIFTGTAGSVPLSQNVLLGNPTADLSSYQSGMIGTGYTYLPRNADLPPSQPTVLTVSPDFTELQPGAINRGTITLQFNDGTARTVSILNVVAAGTTAAGDARLRPDAASCSSKNLEIQWRSPLKNFSATLGQPTTVEVQVVDDCGNPIGPINPQSAAVTATLSNKDAVMNLTHIGNGIWTGTWKPVNPAAVQVIITVTAFYASGQLLQAGQVTESGTLGASSTPIVTAGGVVQAASAVGGVPIAPGSLISIYGSNLAEAAGQSQILPLPNSANGAQVFLGNTPLPILYTSEKQLNVQVPFSAPPNTQYQISVQNGGLVSLPERLVVAQANPGVFTLNEQGTGPGIVLKQDDVTFAQATCPAGLSCKPATTGETVVIYCTGLGAVAPAVLEGTPPPLSPLSWTMNTVTVTIGGQNAPVSFSGLTPGFPGLYQVNAMVPNGVSGSAVPVVVSVAGLSSPPVTIAVQ